MASRGGPAPRAARRQVSRRSRACPGTLDSRYHLGALLARLVSPAAEDKRLYDQAIKDQEALLALDPGDPENRLKLARYLNNLAILEARRDPAKAEREFHKALDLLAGLDPTRASLPGPRWQAARASNNLATSCSGKGRDGEAEKILTAGTRGA